MRFCCKMKQPDHHHHFVLCTTTITLNPAPCPFSQTPSPPLYPSSITSSTTTFSSPSPSPQFPLSSSSVPSLCYPLTLYRPTPSSTALLHQLNTSCPPPLPPPSSLLTSPNRPFPHPSTFILLVCKFDEACAHKISHL